ncbi:MAG TPA: methyltransferase domain-containing protein [Oscillospiraceae bacterium]|nr:methyltransferase domain-containing protein [Oscillospiraceae bacterium]
MIERRNEIKQFFDERAEKWDIYCKCSEEKVAAIVTLAGITAGSHVVDIACGTGVLFPEILSRNPAEILGIDLSDEMIRKARSKFTDSRLRLLASDLFDVHETGFDTAMIFSAYPHFKEKVKLALQVSDMLKSGGRVMVAHCEGKDSINHCHSGETVSQISWPLRAAQEEAAAFSDYFDIDMVADTSDIYFFSGIKKR